MKEKIRTLSSRANAQQEDTTLRTQVLLLQDRLPSNLALAESKQVWSKEQEGKLPRDLECQLNPLVQWMPV